MYDTNAVLDQVSEHVVVFLALGGIALLCNWYYFFECARLAQRDKCAPMALWATTVFIGHDGSYLLRFGTWFHHHTHWFPKLFWIGLIVTFSFEVIFFIQTILFGRKEIAPRLSQTQWTWYCMGALVTGVGFWAVTKSYLDDPIYLMTFLVTFGMCAPATIPFMIKRGDQTGAGARQLWAYLGIGIAYIALTAGLLGGPFRSPLWILGSLICSALAVTMLVLFHRLPRHTPPVSSRLAASV